MRRAAAFLFRTLRPDSFDGVATLIAAAPEQQFLAAKNIGVFHWLQQLPGFSDWSRTQFADMELPLSLAAQRFDLRATLPGTYIPASERGSMRASFEMRAPFLHRGLLERLAEMDGRALLVFGQKSVLRRILYRYLPREVANLPKRGFNFPLSRFLDNVGETPPQIVGTDAALVEEAWRRRYENS